MQHLAYRAKPSLDCVPMKKNVLCLKPILALPFFPRLITTVLVLLCCAGTNAQKWRSIGNEQQLATAASSYTSITTVLEGGISVPYVVFTEGGTAKVKKFTGTTWQAVGGNIATGSPTYTRIVADRTGKLFVSYVDAANSNKLAVKTYNAATSTWEPLNGNAANLYVSTATVTYSISQYSSSPRHQMAFDTANRPMIVYAEGTALAPNVKRFNGTAWESVGSSPALTDIAASVGLAVDSTTNTPYIVYVKQATATSTTGSVAMARFNGTTWESITVPSPVSGGSATTGATTAIRHTSITFNKAWNPIVSYFNTGNSNKNTIIIYNKATSTWAFSAAISTRDAPNSSLVRSASGDVYSSFADAISNGSGRSVARVSMLAANATSWTELKNICPPDGIDEPVGNLSITAANDSSRPIIAYTKTNSNNIVTPVVQVWGIGDTTPIIVAPPDTVVNTPKQVEFLTRGLVAVRTAANRVYIGWRLFGTDSAAIAFNVYRNGTLLNASPITGSTNYTDSTATTEDGAYTIRPVLNGTEQSETAPVSPWSRIYKSLPLQIPPGGTTPDGIAYTYTANDCSVGDVDGDGEYEFFVKWDPSNAKDNSQSGYTGNVYMDCYKLNGTRLWRIDLGRNIRAGAHYTQFMVYDFDGDGKAEMMCKTADATIDGLGTVIGDAAADYRSTAGYVLSGPEFLTVFNGQTGAAMATTNYLPARGSVSSWGDTYGNRVDRFLAVVAYLDGKRPSAIFGRGYYTRLVRAAWDWRNGQLTLRWIFDSDICGNGTYAGQGNHNMSVGDVDGDGKDEVCNGASAINDNGYGKYANGLGHGDALHMTDLDPSRPGQEVFQCHEDPGAYGNYGLEFRDAKTGQPLWGVPGGGADVGRCMVADIDPRYKGYEVWGSVGKLYNCKGDSIANSHPSYNFGIWWDGDLQRELLDGTKLDKWNYQTSSSNRLLTIYNYGNADDNNGTKANPGLTADLLGDWREEMLFRNTASDSLLLFTTTIPTAYRLYTLMHNTQYRTAVAWQNSGYNQPPYPDYYIGDSMVMPAAPNVYTAQSSALPVSLLDFTATETVGKVTLAWKTATEKSSDYFTIERSKDGKTFVAIDKVKSAGNSSTLRTYGAIDARPFAGANYYRLKQTDVDGSSVYSPIRKVTIGTRRETLSISPNPVTTQVKLQLTSTATDVLLRVTASDGKLLMSQTGTIDQLNNQLNRLLPSFASGFYVVELVDDAKTYTGKMLKK